MIVKVGHNKLDSPEESVIDHLANRAEVTNRIARELAGIVSKSTMKLVFLRLAKRNLIDPVPGRKEAASAWQKYTGQPPSAS